MVREMRNDTFQTGLVLANGGIMTYQYAVCLSRKPRRDNLPFPTENVLPAMITDVPIPETDEIADGEATVEVTRFHAVPKLRRSMETDTHRHTPLTSIATTNPSKVTYLAD